MIWSHKITRPDVSGNALYGFVLKTSSKLTLIANEDDFLIDGYKIIRNDDIVLCRPTPTSRYSTHLMKKEGVLADSGIASLVDISSWHSLLGDLKRLEEYVIVEDEQSEEFLIGPIRRLNKMSVTIDYFDGCGKWQKPRIIRYENITCVSFRSRYLDIHKKYIKKR